MIRQLLFNDKVEVGISEISDGNMRYFNGDEPDIIDNQKKLIKSIELDSAARLRTTYDQRENFTKYVEITPENLPYYSIANPENEIPVSDGLATREANLGILLPLADCLGVVAYDEKQNIIALLHAGRHNVEQYGPKKFVEYLINAFGSNAKDIKLYFSPHAVNYRIFKLNNKILGEAAKEQFIEAGILPENIISPRVDTVSSSNFPSNSSGDHTSRFAIVAKQR